MRIDGRKIANEIGAELDDRLSALRGAGVTPTMAMIVATDDDGTAWYIRSLTRAAMRLGIDIRTSELALDASAADISRALARASADPAIHGVICQTPLPGAVRLEDVASSIAPRRRHRWRQPSITGPARLGFAGVPACHRPPSSRSFIDTVSR